MMIKGHPSRQRHPSLQRRSRHNRNNHCHVYGFSLSEISAIVFFLILQVVILDVFQWNMLWSLPLQSNSRNDDYDYESHHPHSPHNLHHQSASVRAQHETTMEQAWDYVQSFHHTTEDSNDSHTHKNSFDRHALSFFHIPKTAGTSIEQVAAEQGLAWGGCAFPHVPKRHVCPHPPGHTWPPNVGWWHLPRQFFPLAHSDPYQFTDLFGVIRHPTARMVSEFYYLCTLRVKEWRPSVCDRTRLYDAAYMNAWIQQHVNETQDMSALEYLMHNSHFTAHWDYVVADAASAGPASSNHHDANVVRMLDYVLKMDDPVQFHNDFSKLMQAFGLSALELREMQSIGSHGKDTMVDHHHAAEQDANRQGKLTTADLTNETIALIEHKYRKDLVHFGYARET